MSKKNTENLDAVQSPGTNRASFSGKLGYVLAAAGSAVGLGNIWRFPYLAAKYGGGMFVLTYIILTITFGYVLIVTETALGRMTRKSPVGAFETFGDRLPFKLGGWINAIIPMLIVPYYSVIGGWVLKYLFEYMLGDRTRIARDGYFGNFIASSGQVELWFMVFAALNFIVILMGVQSGIERISKIMMPILVILAIIIAVFSVTRQGAAAGVRYLFVPDLKNFSIMTVVTAMGQNFYSLSIAMGILYTYGSYMKKDIDIEHSTWEVEIFDTGIALLSALMIIPAVFAFSGGDRNALNAGPSLMFITLPKVFASMGAVGTAVGILFFILVLFAALTSSISLMETSVSTFTDELHVNRKKASAMMVIVMMVIGTLSSAGYGALSGVTVFGMQFLDFFDFLTNSVMMPIAAFATCLLVVIVVGTKKIEAEVEISSRFRWKKLYNVCIRYIAPVCIVIILISSILNVLGIIHM
ncbi:MAG: sodium-dependent transporter [Eubacterium sp.]|nr:sodium-dependent transporter [Eubacterium sp.]